GGGTISPIAATLVSGNANGSVAAALNGLTSISGTVVSPVGGYVTVTRNTIVVASSLGPQTAYIYTVTFHGTLAMLNQNLMSALGASGTTAVASTVADGGIGTQVASGAALELDGSVANFSVVGEALVLNGAGIAPGNAGALRNVVGTNTWTGPVTLKTNSTIGVDAGSQLTVSGLVQDPLPVPIPPSNLTKAGAGTLVFPNANTYAGITTVNAGILNIRNPGALGVTPTEMQTVSVSGSSGSYTLNFNGQTTGSLNNSSGLL